MDDGDGALTMELQARKIAENAVRYNGSHPCPTCGVIMNPMEAIANQGHCLSCLTQRKLRRVSGRMSL